MLVLGGSHRDSKGQSSSVETAESKRFDNALFSTLDALEQCKIQYGLIGGVAAFTHGRPRPTQDIDVFLRPEDADNVLEVLKDYGFKIDRFNPTWIFKAFKEDVLIDIIFRSEGNIYFDEEMNRHTVQVEYHGRPVRVVSVEDFILIKSVAHSEEGHHHWFDALSALAQSKVDWDYLLHRARKAPRRMMALLAYAQSIDIWVPNQVIQNLTGYIYDGKMDTGPSAKAQEQQLIKSKVKTEHGDTYLAATIREALAEDPTTGTLDVEIFVREDKILVRGQVNSDEQRSAILSLVGKIAPSLSIENQLRLTNFDAPKGVEALQ
ncbi:MAG: Conserved Archaeal protein [Pseudobdellovibrio sp.]|jgi:predicted nucleotidyltransferase|nr:Conserved Archaeal protein [Pseudobdellovibrio sp.]